MAGRSTWDRVSAATGIAFVILLLYGVFGVPPAPAAGSSARDLADYFTTNQGALRASLFFGGILPAPFVLWFTAFLYESLRRAGAERVYLLIGVIGVIATVVLALVGSVVWGMLAAGDLGDTPVIKTIYAGYRVDRIGLQAVLPLFTLGFSIPMIKQAATWRLLGYGGVGVGVLSLLTLVLSYATQGRAGLLGLITVLLFALWVLGTSSLLTWRDLARVPQ